MKNSVLTKQSDNMIEKLFFKMLPIQILILAMGSLNSIVDGAMAGRFIGASAVGIIGLYYSMVSVFNAVGSVLLGGTTVLCGKYMGRGDINKTNGIFSLNITVTLIAGAVLTVASVIIPGPIASLLGATEELKPELVRYIMGYAPGIIPMLLAQQIASFLQLERQNTRGYIGVAGMIIANIILDVLLVGVLKMGMLGLAIATSLSNIVYFLILAPYYLSSKAQLHFNLNNILWGDTGKLVKIGVPGALLVFCLAIRGMVINRILITYSGSDGLSAMSAFNMIVGLLIAYCLGNGSVVRMLISVFVGEEDRTSIKQVLKTVFTKGLLLSCALGAVVILVSPILVSIFFDDKTSNVYHLTHQLFIIYGLCIPLILICQIFTNYLQAFGHNAFVNVQSVFDGFFSMVIPSLILAPIMGAFGVWLANPIGIILTILTVPIYNIIYWKRKPRNLDEVLFLKPNFGALPEDVLTIQIHDMKEVADTSEKVQNFCRNHNIDEKTSYYAALSVEEMAGNVINYGFTADNKKHDLSVRVVRRADDILLRIKDDCIPFDPKSMTEIVSGEGEFDSMGIRMVSRIADDMTYQNMLGLNALSITIKEEDLNIKEDTDFLLEKTLRQMDKDLHTRFRDTAFVVRNILSRYRLLFPEYTDHSELHSMTVIDACNRLIGRNQIKNLNGDEIYILLVACYLHDVGMGIGEKDYEEFKDVLGEREYFEKNPEATKADFVRDKHNEFSALFIDKYWEVFDIPSPEHAFAIKQVARGHRKVDLLNEEEYPAEYKLPNGNLVHLPYLAAVIRLADEVDVVATRNPILLYDIGALTDEVEIFENKKLNAIKTMRMTKEAFVLTAETDDDTIRDGITKMARKMQVTLDSCREVVKKRSDFELSQRKVILRFTDL